MNARSGIILCIAVLTLGLFGGCHRVKWCCTPGEPKPATNAACRTGCVCLWPPEGGNLRPNDTPLTPSLNAFINCPKRRDPYKYTQLPFKCDTTRTDRTGFR